MCASAILGIWKESVLGGESPEVDEHASPFGSLLGLELQAVSADLC